MNFTVNVDTHHAEIQLQPFIGGPAGAKHFEPTMQQLSADEAIVSSIFVKAKLLIRLFQICRRVKLLLVLYMILFLVPRRDDRKMREIVERARGVTLILKS